MEDYKFNESSNVGLISSVDYSVSTSSQQSYFNTPPSVSDLVSNYQTVLNMQDDPLSENSSHSNSQSSCQQSSENGNDDQVSVVTQTKDEGISLVNLGNGVQTDSPEQREVSGITSNQLPAYSASEPSLNVINSISSSTLWANNVDDSMIHNFNVPSVNGTLTFQNFSSPDSSSLYDPNLGNHLSGLTSSQLQQPQQRRTMNATQNYPHNMTRNLAQSNLQQSVYLANKMYNNSWNTSQNTWGSSVQNQNNMNNVSTWNSRGRSTPNLNPMQNLSSRKMNPSFAQQQNMLMAQKFRRSTSYPGKNVFSQGSAYDINNIDDTSDLILPYQDHTQLNNGNCYGGTGNGEVDNSVSPLDNMTALHQYLNELMRTGTDLNGDIMNKGTKYVNPNVLRPLHIPSESRPFFPGLDEHAAAAIMENPSSHIVDGQVFMASLPPGAQSSPHALLQEKEEKYSRKVFVGGLPPDIDEEEISASFRRFGQLVVDWPHKAESKSFFPPKGYAFLLFQEESSVQTLIDSCIQEDDKLYLVVSSPTVKDKAVQIRPWRLNDADYVLNASLPLDPRKTVFVGGVPRPLKAIELATIMDRLYGCVCYAGIDTDPELKYPKGAGRVAFSNQQSYIAAISARFVQLQHGDIDKRVEVKPYVLDDQMCDECAGQRCGGKFAPFFCANVTCLQYYCEHCWGVIHSRSGREFHKPLVKEGAERPRPLQFRWC